MNLTQFRTEETGNNVQTVIFNTKGEVLESDDVLTTITDSKFNVFADTMFSGMEETFGQIPVGEALEFDCIETDINGRSSHYDFLIKRIPDEDSEPRFGLVIYDFGKQYQKVFELQQERNLAEMMYVETQKMAIKFKEEKDAIDQLFRKLQEDTSSEYILVKSDTLLVNLNLNEILYFEGYGDYVKVYTSNKMYITYNTLKAVETSLPENQFFRIHRSFIIRLDKIKNIEQLSVEIGGKVLPIGKSHKAALIEKIGQL